MVKVAVAINTFTTGRHTRECVNLMSSLYSSSFSFSSALAVIQRILKLFYCLECCQYLCDVRSLKTIWR